MKKLLLLVLSVILVSSISFAQVGKGTKYVNAASSLSFSSMKINQEHVEGDYEYTMSEFSLKPSLGYFIMDGLAVGITALYESSKSKSEGYESEPYVVYGLGAFGKYYYGQGAIKPFGKAEIGIIGSSEGDEDYEKDSGISFSLGAGAAYFLNEYVAVEAGLDYNKYTLTNKEDSNYKHKVGGILFKIGFTLAF